MERLLLFVLVAPASELFMMLRVNADNARWFYKALIDKGVGAAVYIYLNGGYGSALCMAAGTDFGRWPEDCKFGWIR